MNRALATIVMMPFLAVVPIASQQNDTAVVDSFKAVVERLNRFFSTSPITFHSEPFPVPSGTINYRYKFTLISSAYDVTRTNSLVSPFVGYVTLRLRANSNARHGDIPSVLTKIAIGFQSSEQAKNESRFASCTDEEELLEDEWCVGDVRLNFAYQDGTWIYRSSEQDEGTRIRYGQAARILRLTLAEDPGWRAVLVSAR